MGARAVAAMEEWELGGRTRGSEEVGLRGDVSHRVYKDKNEYSREDARVDAFSRGRGLVVNG